MGYNFDSFAQMVVGPVAVPSFAVSPEALCYFVVVPTRLKSGVVAASFLVYFVDDSIMCFVVGSTVHYILLCLVGWVELVDCHK